MLLVLVTVVRYVGWYSYLRNDLSYTIHIKYYIQTNEICLKLRISKSKYTIFCNPCHTWYLINGISSIFLDLSLSRHHMCMYNKNHPILGLSILPTLVIIFVLYVIHMFYGAVRFAHNFIHSNHHPQLLNLNLYIYIFKSLHGHYHDI